MNHPSDDDFVLSRALEEWRASAPPEDFVSTVVRASQEEGRRAGSVRSGIVVPLLLAALFVSFGAAAAWDSWSRPSAAASPSDTRAVESDKAAMSLSFHSQGDGAHAEPEVSLPEAPRPVLRQLREPEPTFVHESEAVEERPVPPRELHLPRCECGTSGVVCSCSD